MIRLSPSLPLVITGLVGLMTLASPSVAIANPEVDACAGKAAGDSCSMMKLVKPPGGGELQRKTVPGVCRSDECCDLDYSKGSPPETSCHACVACKDGPADATPPRATDDPDPDPPPDSSPEGEPPRAGASDPPAPSPDKRGCHVGAPTPAPAASVLLGLLMLRRRRSR